MAKRIYNYIATGDIHIEKNTPQHRVDDYWGTCQDKLMWIVNTANKLDARILIAGDLFNTSRVSPDITNVVMAILQEAVHVPYVVAGQHDLRFHTSMEKTPIFTLALAGVVRIIQGTYEQFTGAGFEETIPDDENTFLLTHTCITEKEPPFFLPDAISAKNFMNQYTGYTYIISGDYHPAHYRKYKGRHLINVGAMVRAKKDMHNHIPKVWHIDTKNDIVTPLEIPHAPFDKVFDLDAIQYQEEHGIEIDTTKLKELLKSTSDEVTLDNIVWDLYKSMRRGAPNKEFVKEVLENANRT